MAISNSTGVVDVVCACFLAGAIACWPGTGAGIAQAEPPLPRDSKGQSARIRGVFDRAQERWQQESNNVEAAWMFGRAAFDWAEFSTNDQSRSVVAQLGIAACRRGVSLDSNCVAAHYYLGLNLGQLARTKVLGALKLIGEMETVWSTAIRLDPKFDYAGPHRTIGVLYRDAPGWPTSVGSEKKSRLHLEKALELHPEYPGNLITLLEGQLEWGEKKAILDGAPATDLYLRNARVTFQYDAWALDWEDWDRRWMELKRKAGVKDQ